MDQGRLNIKRKLSSRNLWKNLQVYQILVCIERRRIKGNTSFRIKLRI
jgi:hypothetical protein